MAGLSPQVEDTSLVAMTLGPIAGGFAQLSPLLLISEADLPALTCSPFYPSWAKSVCLHQLTSFQCLSGNNVLKEGGKGGLLCLLCFPLSQSDLSAPIANHVHMFASLFPHIFKIKAVIVKAHNMMI